MRYPLIASAGLVAALRGVAVPSPDACTLLTAKDASTLAGQPLTVAANASATDCRYNAAGGPGAGGVEIHIRVDASATQAHADFPRWVLPVAMASVPPGVPVAGVGDEAATRQGPVATGIYIRRGATLVKIGVHPPVTDNARLTAAATAAAARM
jgi:hypothetical protein